MSILSEEIHAINTVPHLTKVPPCDESDANVGLPPALGFLRQACSLPRRFKQPNMDFSDYLLGLSVILRKVRNEHMFSAMPPIASGSEPCRHTFSADKPTFV